MNYSPPNYNEDFRDRIAIVTGAASGIGRSIAEGLSYHRAQICMLDTNETKGHDVLNNLRKNSPSSEFYETDVSDRENVKKTIEKIVSEQGAPWILVNNAGIEYNDDGNLITMPEEKADEMIEFLNSFFTEFKPEIKKIGETKTEKIIFSRSLSLDFNKFKKNYVRDLEEELEKTAII